MQYSSKEHELLGKQVAAGQYVRRSTFVLSLLLALLFGMCLGRYVFPYYGSDTQVSMKRPLSSGSDMAAAVAPNQQLLQSIFQHEEDVRRDPSNAEAWEHLGNLYYDAGEPQKSVNAYNRALVLNPKNSNVLVDCGIMYLQLKQPEQAIAYFDKALAIDPRHENALFNKGVVMFHHLGKKDEAVEIWRTLIAINPQFKTPSGQSVSALVEEHEKQGDSRQN